MARNLYKDVTDRIISQLQAGTVPWKQAWSNEGFGVMPRNAVTNRAYSGVNVILLWARAQDSGFAKPHWLTFKQAKEAGGNVRKGEKGETVVFVSAIEKQDEATGKMVRIPFLKAFTVFNVAQCDGLPEKIDQSFAPRHSEGRDAEIDEFLSLSGADIRHGDQRAYWTRKMDFINMPAFETFDSAGDYYATMFHELTHWTGHETRLNRTAPKKMADEAYSFEELVAELGAAFLCAEFGISNNEGADAAYIAHWVKFLGDNETAIVSAASQASKAAEYLRQLTIEQPMAIAAE